MKLNLTDPNDVEEYLATCWCEINGGGVVTQDQLDHMEQIKDDVYKRAQEAQMREWQI